MEFRKSVMGMSLALLAAWSSAAFAQDHHGGRGDGGRDFQPSAPRESAQRFAGPNQFRDQQRAYPARGAAVAALPAGSVAVRYRGGRYFYRGGVWYRPYGGRYVVFDPPFGIVVPVLPFYYSTVWAGGVPYYYANGVYYTAAPYQNPGYVVVAPPPGVELNDAVAAGPVANPMQPIVYPRQGQSPQQTVRDRQECNVWANAQPDSASDPGIYERAIAACLDGRGYTVR